MFQVEKQTSGSLRLLVLVLVIVRTKGTLPNVVLMCNNLDPPIIKRSSAFPRASEPGTQNHLIQKDMRSAQNVENCNPPPRSFKLDIPSAYSCRASCCVSPLLFADPSLSPLFSCFETAVHASRVVVTNCRLRG